MWRKKDMKKLVLSLITTILIACSSYAQTFNLSKFTNVNGLPQNYIYSIIQDPNGYVWIAMAEGLSRYDGMKFTNFTVRDSLCDNFVSKLLIDTDGRLWCGHGNGEFSVYEDYNFSKVHVPEVSSPIKDMCFDDKGNIWAVEQNNGLIRISPDKQVTTFFDRELFQRRVFYSVRAINSMTLLVGTSEGLMLVKLDVDGAIKEPQDIMSVPCSAVNCIVDCRDGRNYWIGLEDGMIFKYAPGNDAVMIERCMETCSQEEMEMYNIRNIFEDEQGNLYIGTWGQGLKEWRYSAETNQYIEALSLNETNGLGNNFVSDILVDREGIFWFATYGGGVIAWINNYFAQYNLSDIGFQRNKVISSIVDEGSLWLGLNNGLVKMDVQCMANFEYFDNSLGLPQGAAITSICFDKNRDMQYVATDIAGVYYKKTTDQSFKKLNYDVGSRTTEKVNSLAIDNFNLYIATQGGFLVYDLETANCNVYTTMDGLPHNNINYVYIDGNGEVWIGPKDSGIARFTAEKEFEVHRLSDAPVNVIGMTHDSRDRMWLATINNGIICSNNDSIISISTADGLEKNYCYGIATDGNDRIWVCHQPGLSCIDLNTGNIRTFNATNGVGQEFMGVSCDNTGDLWFSSASGVVHYMTRNDKRNSVAPTMNLSRIMISGKRHDLTQPIDLSYPYSGDVDKFEFDFIGICMKDPINVRYEYWLQYKGSEDERWMPLGTQSHKEYDFLPDGDYILQVRAFNSDGIVSEKPLRIPIHIDAPFWKSIWFPIILSIIVIVVIRIVTKARERKLRERQEELEKEVNRQTIMLSRQKAEIEKKNNDIMDSINYAKRIQTAILPSRNSLDNFQFDSSFILFMPRDIVSGDFYWFNQFDNKILICCGDCTGHGVPGAFMSMIGTTILNDATRDPEKRNPMSLLYTLDKEVKSTLNKNQSVDTQDGMDCAILEINIDTLEVRSAAARRPIYFFINGRLNEVRGTRRSIGDHRNGNDFVETITQLRKGDTIYLTSDGFSDQFGEEKDDKYTAGALKRFIESIVNEPMYNQQKALEKEFRRWKGKREQIDDVIVMGIRL